jgi:hypothetical protein
VSRLEIGVYSGRGVFEACKWQLLSACDEAPRTIHSRMPRQLTLCRSEERVCERKGNKACKGKDKEREELALLVVVVISRHDGRVIANTSPRSQSRVAKRT